MSDKYMLPNTEQGAALRAHIAESLALEGIETTNTIEYIEVGSLEFGVLVLTKLGKRKLEGQIAARMKESKAHD